MIFGFFNFDFKTKEDLKMGGAVFTQYGPHSSQKGLSPLYKTVEAARTSPQSRLAITDVVAFPAQKHGMRTKPAIGFGMVVGGRPLNMTAGVMGGISAGIEEANTHPSIAEALSFYEANVRQQLVGLNVGRPQEITRALREIDEAHRGKATMQNLPDFSYVGAEISIGVSMMASIALAEKTGVPLEVVLSYRYNELAMSRGLADSVRPITIPVNFSVVWEGGKHGAALTLPEMIERGIITDSSKFPARFHDAERIAKGDKDILLAMVPPQETQVMVLVPTWQQAHDIGVKLTKIFEAEIKKEGIKPRLGAESGFTTDQVKTGKGDLITQELILQILDRSVDKLGDDAQYVRYAWDIASSEIYIPEIDMYYIGPKAAGNGSGLVSNEAFTAYKLRTLENHPRFLSVEDWAKEDVMAHWDSQRQILDTHIGMGDDNTVSHPRLVREFTEAGNINAHLQKPNQSAEEEVQMDAVATSHNLGNVVVWSHRGTRPADEIYTASGAMGTGSFAGKWTLWGVGRGPLIERMNYVDRVFNGSLGVETAYQGGLVLDPRGPYRDVSWARRMRQEING